MGEMTRGEEAEVERGQPAAGDSVEQREAEAVTIRLLGERLGVALEKRKLSLPGGGRIELDGACDDPPTLVEAWAHQGPPKSAQKAKVWSLHKTRGDSDVPAAAARGRETRRVPGRLATVATTGLTK